MTFTSLSHLVIVVTAVVSGLQVAVIATTQPASLPYTGTVNNCCPELKLGTLSKVVCWVNVIGTFRCATYFSEALA